MIRSRFIIVATIAATAMSGTSASAQCSGSDTCSTQNVASVTVGALVNLQMSATTTTLTAPVIADLAAGFVADVGPTFTVQANQDWVMSIKAASSNPTNWSYTGTKTGVKSIADLTWSSESNGTFAALTGSNASVASSASATNETSVAVFFKTIYSSDYSDASNRPGVYSLPLVFTLTAP